MKKIFSLLLACALVTFCSAEELIVSPQNTQGWTFGTGQSTQTKTTANWFLGYLKGFPQLGDGSLWFYSGNSDGWVYADFKWSTDIPLGSITRLNYSTYTSDVEAGREDINIAPSFNIYLNVPGNAAGSVVLDHSPGVYGKVTREQWLSRNILSSKWTCNKSDSTVKRTLDEWLEIYPSATINKIRIQTGGTNPLSKRIFGGWTMGVDNVIIGYGLNPPITYNFEPNTKEEILKSSVNPSIIIAPNFYINSGMVEGDLSKASESLPEDESVTPAKPSDEKPNEVAPPKSSPYVANDGLYVPILFQGNTTLKAILSQLTNVGNPDETILLDDKIAITKGGNFLFGGVPFYIPSNKNNSWDANAFSDDVEHQLNIKVGLENVLEAHTIINMTYSTGESGTLFLVFTGSKGDVFVKELKINKDVRDMRTSAFSTIVAPTKVVWSRPLSSRPNQGNGWEIMLDSQTIVLPPVFQGQELTSVTVVDKGKKNKQRCFIAGLTLKLKITKLTNGN